jgi:GNAT superfamily N-acetyltransferase
MIVAAATAAELEAVAALVNRAYRGDPAGAAWTTESHLLKGPRTSAAGLARDLADQPGALILTLRDAPGRPLVGSVWLKPEGEGTWYLGLFAVDPLLQDRGLGRTLLAEAEAWARRAGARRMRMTVIEVRDELRAWYERRGYRLTGDSEPFPGGFERVDPAGAPFRLAVLEKPLG